MLVFWGEDVFFFQTFWDTTLKMKMIYLDFYDMFQLDDLKHLPSLKLR